MGILDDLDTFDRKLERVGNTVGNLADQVGRLGSTVADVGDLSGTINATASGSASDPGAQRSARQSLAEQRRTNALLARVLDRQTKSDGGAKIRSGGGF